MKQNPLDNLVLTKEEQKLEESLKIGHWSRIDTTNKWKKELQEMAKNTLELRKSKKITLRVNQGDLIKLKTRAQKKNIPYQTLLSALIRNYVEGKYSVRL